MECAEVKRGDLEVRNEVNADARRIRVGWWVSLLEPALVADGDQVIGVNRLDVRADCLCPRIDRRTGGVACCRRGTGRPRAARLVGKLPSHNRRLVDVASDELADVFFVCSDNRGVCVERVVRSARVELRHVDVHAAVIGPVVRQRDDEADAVRLGGAHDIVEVRNTIFARVERRHAVGP